MDKTICHGQNGVALGVYNPVVGGIHHQAQVKNPVDLGDGVLSGGLGLAGEKYSCGGIRHENDLLAWNPPAGFDKKRKRGNVIKTEKGMLLQDQVSFPYVLRKEVTESFEGDGYFFLYFRQSLMTPTRSRPSSKRAG
jgi:hypothetical protein